MHKHGPDSLAGPLRGTSAWWHGRPVDDEPPIADEALAPEEPLPRPARANAPRAKSAPNWSTAFDPRSLPEL